MSEEPAAEEKKPNPILNELDKEASAAPAADAAATPPAQPQPPAAESAPTPPAEPPPPMAEASAPQPEEASAVDGPSHELVTDAMRRLDDILKKIKEKKVDPAP